MCEDDCEEEVDKDEAEEDVGDTVDDELPRPSLVDEAFFPPRLDFADEAESL
jgi:hypothetical protein